MSKLNLELLSENEISDFLAGVDSLGTDKDTDSESQKWEKLEKFHPDWKILKMMRWIRSANRIRFEQSILRVVPLIFSKIKTLYLWSFFFLDVILGNVLILGILGIVFNLDSIIKYRNIIYGFSEYVQSLCFDIVGNQEICSAW